MRSSDDPNHAERLIVETEHAEHEVRISLRGTADVATLLNLEDALANLDLDGQKDVQIDVSGLDFVDIPGFRRLVVFARESRQSDHIVTTSGAPPVLQQMASIFEVSDDLGL